MTVVAALRERIVTGTLGWGDAVSEVTLADEFGVSRTPVREALKQLQAEGLIVTRPRVGSFVSTPSRLEIVELYQMKEILEGAAARLFASRGDLTHLEHLRENVRRFAEAAEAGRREDFIRLVNEFHEIVVAGAGNVKLTTHYRMLMNQLTPARLIATSLSVPGRPAESVAEHRAILEMIEAKDGATAEKLMRVHVVASQEAVLAGLSSV